jgi:hypothetical protein
MLLSTEEQCQHHLRRPQFGRHSPYVANRCTTVQYALPIRPSLCGTRSASAAWRRAARCAPVPEWPAWRRQKFVFGQAAVSRLSCKGQRTGLYCPPDQNLLPLCSNLGTAEHTVEDKITNMKKQVFYVSWGPLGVGVSMCNISVILSWCAC